MENHPIWDSRKTNKALPLVKNSHLSSHIPELHRSYQMINSDHHNTATMSADRKDGVAAPNRMTVPAGVTVDDFTTAYMLKLRSLLHPIKVLEDNGFVVQQLSGDAIDRKKKCQRCHKAIQKGKLHDEKRRGNQGEKKDWEKQIGEQSMIPADETNTKPAYAKQKKHEKSLVQFNELPKSRLSTFASTLQSTSKPTLAPEPVLRCKFHEGIVLQGANNQKKWSCCGQHLSSNPCKATEYHMEYNYPKGFLERSWQFFTTPSLPTLSTICPAVAIDCEMGIAKSGDSELIRVTVIDYFSSSVLIDSLVYPDVALEHYNTRFSGVTKGQMEAARRRGQCFMGKRQAREAVWRYVGPETVLVGHAVDNDLNALRMIHTTVIDTMLIEAIPARAQARAAKKKIEKEAKAEAEAKAKVGGKNKAKTKAEGSGANNEAEERIEATSNATEKKTEDQQEKTKKPKGSGPLALKTLARTRLGRDIQTGGKMGHDSLEDAIASRDLAHWLVVNNGKDEIFSAIDADVLTSQ